MSQENVETVRRCFDAFRLGDLRTLDAVLDPAVVWRQMEEPEEAHGPVAVMEALERWTEMWTDAEVTPQEWIDAGESVVVRVKWTGRSKVTGIPVEQFAYNVFTVRAGRVVGMQEYGAQDRADALAAAGLTD